VINEIMYNPTNSGAAFMEIFNNSSFAFDLSGWRVNGLATSFPKEAFLAGRQVLALAKNRSAYAGAYARRRRSLRHLDGTSMPRADTHPLLKPGVQARPTSSSTRFAMKRALPWATNANGGGASLQLIVRPG